MRHSRRAFLQQCTSGMTWLALASRFPDVLALPASAPSRVVVARDDRLIRVNDDLDREASGRILDVAVQRITGQPSPDAAWRALFSPTERVVLKVSCLPGRKLSTSVGLVGAVIDGLNRAGVPASAITVWERTSRELKAAGFRLSKRGVKVLGTDALPAGGYSSRVEFARSVGTCFSTIMEQADAVISLPVLKDHDIAGISAGMKNFYGAIYNPNKYHGNRCNPFVADLCSHPFIRDRLRLVVLDASRIQLHNGPAYFARYARDYGALVVGVDPVAVDAVGWRLLDTERVAAGLKSLAAEKRTPAYIETAAAIGLGHVEERNIERIEL